MPPPYVSPGQPITSAWGNDVVYTLGEIDGRLTGQIAAANSSINSINSRLANNIRGGITTLDCDVNGHYYVYFGHTFPIVPAVVGNLAYDDVIPPRFMSVRAVTQTYVVFIIHTMYGFVSTGITTFSWIAFTGGL